MKFLTGASSWSSRRCGPRRIEPKPDKRRHDGARLNENSYGLATRCSINSGAGVDRRRAGGKAGELHVVSSQGRQAA